MRVFPLQFLTSSIDLGHSETFFSQSKFKVTCQFTKNSKGKNAETPKNKLRQVNNEAHSTITTIAQKRIKLCESMIQKENLGVLKMNLQLYREKLHNCNASPKMKS